MSEVVVLLARSAAADGAARERPPEPQRVRLHTPASAEVRARQPPDVKVNAYVGDLRGAIVRSISSAADLLIPDDLHLVAGRHRRHRATAR